MIGVSRSAEMCSSLYEGLQAQILCGSDSNPLRGCHEKQVLRGWILAKWKRTLYKATFARFQKKSISKLCPFKILFLNNFPAFNNKLSATRRQLLLDSPAASNTQIIMHSHFFSEDCDIFVQQKLISPVYLFNACPSHFGHSFIYIYIYLSISNCIYFYIIYILYIKKKKNFIF